MERQLLFEAERMKVFEVKSDKGTRVVKQYVCSRIEEGDLLLKEAIAQAHLPYPLWSALAEVSLKKTGAPSFGFTVDFVLQKRMQTLPREVIEKDDRSGRYQSGLEDYEFRSEIYRREGVGSVHVAWSRSRQREVAIKGTELLINVERANTMVAEGIVQAHVIHVHNTQLLDIALLEPKPGLAQIFLVMEKLEKDVASEIKERRVFSEDELLELLFQVASGLMHAKTKVRHTQNIAHRDIKPENIFVGADGRYKVGDFGSAWVRAKEKEKQPAGCTELQRILEKKTESAGGTPLYLSPEMRNLLLGGGESVDPFASDVYSLGVTMLHLASGKESLDICDPDLSIARAAVQREVSNLKDLGFLRVLLTRMLEINVKLRPTVEELYLKVGERKGWAKWASEVKSMTPAQLAVEEVQWVEEYERLKGAGESEELARTSGVLAGIYLAQEKLALAEEFSKQSLKMHLSHLREHPETANAHYKLSLVYLEMKRLDKAEASAKASLKIFLETTESGSVDAAVVCSHLSLICKARGKFRDAAELAKRSLSVFLERFGENHPVTAGMYNNLSTLYQAMGRLSDAAKYAEKSLVFFFAQVDRSLPDIAKSLINLSSIYKAMGRLPEAEKCAKESIRAFLASVGENSSSTATAYNNLSAVYKAMGRLPEAMEYAKKSMSIFLAIIGENNLDIAACFNNLASLYRLKEKFSKAEGLAQKALSIRLECPEFHPDTARCYHNLACILLGLGRLPEALECAEKSLYLKVVILGDKHPDTVGCYSTLASTYHKLKRLPEAAASAKKSLLIVLARLPPSCAWPVYRILSAIYVDMGQLREAEHCVKKLLTLMVSAAKANDADIMVEFSNLAAIYKMMGRLPEAVEYTKKSLSVRLVTRRTKSLEIAADYYSLAFLYRAMRQLVEAEEYGRKSLEVRLETLDKLHPAVAESYLFLSSTERIMGKLEEAKEFSEKFLEIRLNTVGENHLDTARAYNNLAAVYKEMGNTEQAIPAAKAALKILLETFGENHPDTATAFYNLASIYRLGEYFPEALEYAEKALRITEEVKGTQHFDTAKCICLLATIQDKKEQKSEAARLSWKALRRFAEKMTDSHPVVSHSLSITSLLLRKFGNYDLAENIARKALERKISSLGEYHPKLEPFYSNLSAIYLAMGRTSEAIEFEKKAMNVRLNPVLCQSAAAAYDSSDYLYSEMEQMDDVDDYLIKAVKYRIQKIAQSHSTCQKIYSKLLESKLQKIEKEITNKKP